jgi:hypothetical protein
MSRTANFHRASSGPCPNCGHHVSGGWELSQEYDNGAQYRRTFHTPEVCAVRKHDRDTHIAEYTRDEQYRTESRESNERFGAHSELIKEAFQGGHIAPEEAGELSNDLFTDSLTEGQARTAAFETDMDRIRTEGRAKRAELSEAVKTSDAAYRARKKSGAPAPKAAASSKPKGFPNKFAGKCADCGSHVPEGEGLTTKENGKWAVRHSSH